MFIELQVLISNHVTLIDNVAMEIVTPCIMVSNDICVYSEYFISVNLTFYCSVMTPVQIKFLISSIHSFSVLTCAVSHSISGMHTTSLMHIASWLCTGCTQYLRCTKH